MPVFQKHRTLNNRRVCKHFKHEMRDLVAIVSCVGQIEVYEMKGDSICLIDILTNKSQSGMAMHKSP